MTTKQKKQKQKITPKNRYEHEREETPSHSSKRLRVIYTQLHIIMNYIMKRFMKARKEANKWEQKEYSGQAWD
jgi:hypothetical protein